jgi:hypothetical protein
MCEPFLALLGFIEITTTDASLNYMDKWAFARKKCKKDKNNNYLAQIVITRS